jgi:hypothetical protein
MENPRQESEFERKGRLIEVILDDVLPFTEGMSPVEIEQREIDRQMHVLRSDLGSMTADEVQHVILEHMYSDLPAKEH